MWIIALEAGRGGLGQPRTSPVINQFLSRLSETCQHKLLDLEIQHVPTNLAGWTDWSNPFCYLDLFLPSPHLSYLLAMHAPNSSPYWHIKVDKKHKPVINFTGCLIDPVAGKVETKLRDSNMGKISKKNENPWKANGFIMGFPAKKKNHFIGYYCRNW